MARRCLWDAIGAKLRQGCSIVLTSHSMEECEALCNRLIIMVNGQICCLGTPLHLKNKFGQGYTVLIKVSPAPIFFGSPLPSSSSPRPNNRPRMQLTSLERFGNQQMLNKNLQLVKTFMSSTFPSSSLKATHNNLLHYTIDQVQDGEETTLKCSTIFAKLESNKTRLKIEDYSVCQTNLEQIFLTFAQTQRENKSKKKSRE